MRLSTTVRAVPADPVVEINRTSAAAVMSFEDAIEQALSALGDSGALNGRLPRTAG